MIVPFVKTDEGYSISDDLLLYVYGKMNDQKLTKIVFPAGEVATVEKWMTYLKNPRNQFHFGTNQTDIVGFAWLNGIAHNHAFAHFCTFKDIWGQTVQYGVDTLTYWFQFPLDVLLARIPTWNKLALKYVKRLGFTEIGTIPKVGLNAYNKKNMDLRLFYLERGHYGR